MTILSQTEKLPELAIETRKKKALGIIKKLLLGTAMGMMVGLCFDNSAYAQEASQPAKMRSLQGLFVSQ